MKTVRISLNSIDKVKSFVNDLAKFDVDFDHGFRQICHRRKILWVSSAWICPSQVDLSIHAENDVDSILSTLSPYIID